MSQAAGNGDAGPGPDAITEEARSAEQAARIAELEDARLRALADLDNVRKRCAAQIHRAEEEARAAVARQWLPVIDSLDPALAHATADPATIVGGVEAGPGPALGTLAR